MPRADRIVIGSGPNRFRGLCAAPGAIGRRLRLGLGWLCSGAGLRPRPSVGLCFRRRGRMGSKILDSGKTKLRGASAPDGSFLRRVDAPSGCHSLDELIFSVARKNSRPLLALVSAGGPAPRPASRVFRQAAQRRSGWQLRLLSGENRRPQVRAARRICRRVGSGDCGPAAPRSSSFRTRSRARGGVGGGTFGVGGGQTGQGGNVRRGQPSTGPFASGGRPSVVGSRAGCIRRGSGRSSIASLDVGYFFLSP